MMPTPMPSAGFAIAANPLGGWARHVVARVDRRALRSQSHGPFGAGGAFDPRPGTPPAKTPSAEPRCNRRHEAFSVDALSGMLRRGMRGFC
jgi:hypothetical protein